MLEKKFVNDEKGDDIAPFDGTLLQYYTLKKFLDCEDQYLNVARSTFTNGLSELPICTRRLVIRTMKYCQYFFTENLYLYISVTVRKDTRQGKPIMYTRKSLFVMENSQEEIFAA